MKINADPCRSGKTRDPHVKNSQDQVGESAVNYVAFCNGKRTHKAYLTNTPRKTTVGTYRTDSNIVQHSFDSKTDKHNSSVAEPEPVEPKLSV